MRTGIVNTGDNVYSYSDARQTITIPSNTTVADLTLYLYTRSSEPATLAIPEKKQDRS